MVIYGYNNMNSKNKDEKNRAMHWLNKARNLGSEEARDLLINN